MGHIYMHPDCGQPCTEPELKRRSGQPITILRAFTEPDATHDWEVLPMFAIRCDDGHEAEAFRDELTWTDVPRKEAG